jgi:hypothetical protein
MTAMLVEEALVQILRENTNLAALIGNRIYANYLTQSTVYPAVYYEQSDEVEIALLQSPGASGLVMAVFDLFSVSQGIANVAACKRVAEAVRQAMIHFPGGTVVDSADAARSIEIQKIFPADVGTDQEYDAVTQTYRFVRTFNVWAVKAIPV